MRHHREDIVERAVQVLDDYGLASLTMRRLGSELGLQASAHLPPLPQQAGPARRGRRRGAGPWPAPPGRGAWDDLLVEACYELRDAMLAYRDGADLVATVYAFGLGAQAPADELEEILAAAGFTDPLVDVGARTLLHFVFGHTFEEQTALQAESAGAIDGPPAGDRASDFDVGLGLVLDGLAAHAPRGTTRQGLTSTSAPCSSASSTAPARSSRVRRSRADAEVDPVEGRPSQVGPASAWSPAGWRGPAARPSARRRSGRSSTGPPRGGPPRRGPAWPGWCRGSSRPATARRAPSWGA